MSQEQPIGIITYGYAQPQAELVASTIGKLLNEPPILLSASGKEDVIVRDIMEGGLVRTFEQKDTKIIMLLGFDDQQIGEVLNGFPKDGSIPRPIFCGLTQQNAAWKWKELVLHLIEERTAMAAQR